MRKMLAFFGAFNPPTRAHLELAKFALEKTGRAGVLFVPSKSVYIREEQGKDFAFGDEERLEMLRVAAAERPWMQVTDCEIRQERQKRTYDTLCHLREEGIDASLLLGSDKLPELERGWYNVSGIAKEMGIVCLSRGADDCRAMIENDPFLSSLSPYIRVLETPPQFKSVSSTAVRARLRAMRALQNEISDMVPAEICSLLMGKFR